MSGWKRYWHLQVPAAVLARVPRNYVQNWKWWGVFEKDWKIKRFHWTVKHVISLFAFHWSFPLCLLSPSFLETLQLLTWETLLLQKFLHSGRRGPHSSLWSYFLSLPPSWLSAVSDHANSKTFTRFRHLWADFFVVGRTLSPNCSSVRCLAGVMLFVDSF